MSKPPAIYFVVTRERTENWDWERGMREQDQWDDHAAFMDGLVDDGFIILGGPVGDGAETLHLVVAAAVSEVEARLAADPWAVAGMLRIGVIEPWALWLDGRGEPDGATVGAPPAS